VVLTYSDGIWTLYVNGVQEAVDSSRTAFASQSSDGLALGQKGTATADKFFGMLDEVTLYSRRLAASEVSALFADFGKCGVTGEQPPDREPPVISITSPAANAIYQLNAIVGASYTCTDRQSTVFTCQGPVARGSTIDTSSAGLKSFTVTSTDVLGNSSSATVMYSVVSGGGGGATAADLDITLLAPAKVSPGATLTYEISIANAGKATATGVVVIDGLPAGTVFASATASQGAISAPAVGSEGTLTAHLGTLAKGANATVTVVVTVTAGSGTMLTNMATVSASTQDLNNNNNSATQKTAVSKK
jgi:uncharacterized repeat protein (TIGR01451 family)